MPPIQWQKSLEDWLQYLQVIRGLSANTIKTYSTAVNQFFVWADEQGLENSEVAPGDIEAWQKYQVLESGHGASTRAVKLMALRSFFGWREHQGFGASPARFTPIPKRPILVPRKYSSVELSRLFVAATEQSSQGVRDKALLLFLYATGARREEAARLKMHQLIFGKNVGYLHFRGKGAKERVVSFGSELKDALESWLIERDRLSPTTDAVWISLARSTYGKSLSGSGLRAILCRLARAASIRPGQAHLHKFRVTFATDLYDAGIDLEQIRHLMGHEDIQTTRRYLAISDKQLNARMPDERLSLLLGKGSANTPLWVRERLTDG